MYITMYIYAQCTTRQCGLQRATPNGTLCMYNIQCGTLYIYIYYIYIQYICIQCTTREHGSQGATPNVVHFVYIIYNGVHLCIYIHFIYTQYTCIQCTTRESVRNSRRKMLHFLKSLLYTHCTVH